MTAIPAQWHDGRSTASQAVRIERVGAGLLRLHVDGGGSVDWPLVEVALAPRLGSTPRVLRRPGHGQLECAHSPLLEAWFPRPSSRIEAMADWLERRRAAIAVAALVAVAFVAVFFNIGVPWMAKLAAERVPVAVERAASDQADALLGRLYFDDSRLPAARREGLLRGFEALVDGEPRSEQMRVAFVHAPVIGANAFALPDGRLYVTDALVEVAGSDDEVLAVLAHEAGHHVHRHGMRRALEGASVMLMVGLAFGDASGSSLAVSIPATVMGSAFSRGHETEADDYALELLARRGIDPGAFATILGRIAGEAGTDDGVLGYVASHPSTARRIEAARRAGQAAGRDPGVPPPGRGGEGGTDESR
ncbi:M48 family metallopeptidase [Luteimonas sp. A534]